MGKKKIRNTINSKIKRNKSSKLISKICFIEISNLKVVSPLTQPSFEFILVRFSTTTTKIYKSVILFAYFSQRKFNQDKICYIVKYKYIFCNHVLKA